MAFGYHFTFFLVLPIRLKISKSNAFLPVKMSVGDKSGALQRFRIPKQAQSASGAQYFQTYMQTVLSCSASKEQLVFFLYFKRMIHVICSD